MVEKQEKKLILKPKAPKGPKPKSATPRGLYQTAKVQTLVDQNIKKTNEKPNLQLNTPQRLKLPIYFNTPNREGITKIQAQKRLQDYNILAQACNRAGRVRDEGRAYYSMGVLLDNAKQFDKAIDYYAKFLRVCQMIEDNQGCALAHNCIGVDIVHLLDQVNNEQLSNNQQITKAELLELAEQHYLKQKDMGDIRDKYLAHLNLGLLYQKKNEKEKAAVNQQMALRLAMQLQDTECQTVAIGNLGSIETQDLNRSKVLASKYLDLCEQLKDKQAMCSGHLQLGFFNEKDGQLQLALENFQKVFEISLLIKDQDLSNQSRILCGWINGRIKWEEYKKKLLSNAKNKFVE